ALELAATPNPTRSRASTSPQGGGNGGSGDLFLQALLSEIPPPCGEVASWSDSGVKRVGARGGEPRKINVPVLPAESRPRASVLRMPRARLASPAALKS